MNDLRQLMNDISSLTAIEREELAALLDEKRSAQASDVPLAHSEQGFQALEAEDWLIAESLSLEREANDLARSLDDTLNYVRSRCDAIRRVA